MHWQFRAIGMVAIFSMIVLNGVARAHFGLVIPSDNMVMQKDDREVVYFHDWLPK